MRNNDSIPSRVIAARGGSALRKRLASGLVFLLIGLPIHAQSQLKRPASKEAAGTSIRQRMIASWLKELNKAEKMARGGAKARRLADRAEDLLCKVSEHVATGHEKLIARVLRLSALSNVDARQKSSALWWIESAEVFWPQVTGNLSTFGSTGKKLARLLRRDEKWKTRTLRSATSKSKIAPPRQLVAFHLSYPLAARAAKLEGRVGLRFVIDSKGRVHWPEVLEESTSTHASALLLAALKTVRSVRFEPARKGWRAVASSYTVVFGFKKP